MTAVRPVSVVLGLWSLELINELEVMIAPHGFEVVGRALEVDKLLAACRSRDPALAIVDVTLRGSFCADTLRRLQEKCTATRVVAFIPRGTRGVAPEAIGWGASHYILEPFDPHWVIPTLCQVAQGVPVVAP